MTTVIRAAVLIAMAVTAAPSHAQVQPPQDRINTALARAQQVGIPVALLESKIAEGKAKGVSLERIAAVVERRQAALERAMEATKGQEAATPMELGVAADAIEHGVSGVVLQAVRDAAPRERRAVAIAALTHLVAAGHVPEAALERVREALARGPEALLNLPAEAGAGRGGSPAGMPARGRPEGVAGGPPAAVPAPGGETQATRPGGPPSQMPAGGRGRP